MRLRAFGYSSKTFYRKPRHPRSSGTGAEIDVASPRKAVTYAPVVELIELTP
jgi:hypothetical protein